MPDVSKVPNNFILPTPPDVQELVEVLRLVMQTSDPMPSSVEPDPWVRGLLLLRRYGVDLNA